MNILIVIGIMALATFPIRAISLLVFSERRLPPITLRVLSLVPIAVVSALCGPLIFHPSDTWENPFFLIEVWASLGAIMLSRYGMLPAIIAGTVIYVVGKIFI
jgi:branched-subunit amino acid transport protein